MIPYTRATARVVLSSRVLSAAALSAVGLPLAVAGGVLIPLTMLFTPNIWFPVGLFVGYPLTSASVAVGAGVVVASLDGSESSRDVRARVRAHLGVLAAWGAVAGVLTPFMRFLDAIPGQTTALEDTLYMARRAVFYVPQTAVIDGDGSQVQELFAISGDRYQAFHGSAPPATEIGGELRLIGTVLVGLGVGLGVLIDGLPVLWSTVIAAILAAGIYTLTKHVGHTLLFLYNRRGDPDSKAPSQQLSAELYAAVVEDSDEE